MRWRRGFSSSASAGCNRTLVSIYWPAVTNFSRRDLLAAAGLASLNLAKAAAKDIPVGLEMYSVRDELAKDIPATVRAVAGMGYQILEFFAPYYNWTPDQARETRKLMDDLGVQCRSTHNGPVSFTPEGLKKAIELNQILGSKYIVMASAGRVNGLDGWKTVAGQLSSAAATLKPLNMAAGYHNHKFEFVALEGKRPMDVLAMNTPAEVMLQFDVGTCVEAGEDPIAWIGTHPGRIRSVHCKDWAPGEGKGFRVLFGEGVSPWKQIFAAAELKGGVEFYLIEQEGSRFSSLETAQRCLATWKAMRAS